MNKINIYLISKFMGLKLFGIENYLQEKKNPTLKTTRVEVFTGSSSWPIRKKKSRNNISYYLPRAFYTYPYSQKNLYLHFTNEKTQAQ